jgi:copper chaperone CopZ
MTCASCQANVQRALAATPGVTQAAVNLMMHEATITFDPSVLDAEKLVAAINETGYESPAGARAERWRRTKRASGRSGPSITRCSASR